MSQSLKLAFREARAEAIRESFGGDAIYQLLKSRNPEIDLILNAGIATGAHLAEKFSEIAV